MDNTSDLQVMQQTLRGLMLALCASTPIDRAKLASALTALSAHPGIDPRAAACLQDLAQGMTAIAPGGAPPQ